MNVKSGVGIALALALVSGCEHADGGSEHESYLREVAQMYQIRNPPRVEVIREVSVTEQLALVERCMHDGGWFGTRLVDGGLLHEPPVGQETEANRAVYICFAKFPLLQAPR